MLGFGVGGAVTFLTPVILAVATEVVTFLALELSKQLKAETTDTITALIKRLFKPLKSKAEAAGADGGSGGGSKPAADPPPLSQQQLTKIRKLVYEKAKQFQLVDDQAALLADSMVGNLVVT